MSLESINIPVLKADLLKKLDASRRTGLFLAPLVKKFALTPTDVDDLIDQLTADGALRLDSPWTRQDTGEITEVSFVRGESE